MDLRTLKLPDRPEGRPALDGDELDALVSATVDLVFVIDRDGRILKFGAGGRHRQSISAQSLVKRRLDHLVPPEEASRYLALIRQALDTATTQRLEYQVELGGEELWFSASVVPSKNNTVVWIARDITEQRAAESALRASEGAHRELLASLPIIVYWVSPTPPFEPTYVSPGIEALGYTVEEWFAVPDMWLRSLHPDDRDRVVAETEAAIATATAVEYEYRILTKNGETRWIHDRGEFVRDAAGEVLAWRGVMIDVTVRRALEDRLAAISEEDELTGLLNRRGFRRMAEQALKIEQRTGRRAALLYLDLDDFKHVNDVHGHAAGDRALQLVADVLRQSLRDGDLVARFGGDEFVIFASGIGQEGEGQRLADRIRTKLAAAQRHRTDHPPVGATIGVIELQGAARLDDLLETADARMRERKALKTR